jgi:hypothetical protein
MPLDRELTRRVRRLDQYELRRLMILVRGLLVHLDGEPEAGDPDLPAEVTYRQRWIRCGKPSCQRCPHGPYWYATWQEDGRARTAYIGRHLPGQEPEIVVPDLPARADRSERS